jgi:hypothetical protein
VILAGALLAAWGALVMWFAKPLHAGWRETLRSVGGAKDAAPGSGLLAPARGVVWIRRAGLAGLVVGLAVSAAGALRLLAESM